MSREKILKSIASNTTNIQQTIKTPAAITYSDKTATFQEMLKLAGGTSKIISHIDEVTNDIKSNQNQIIHSDYNAISSLNNNSIKDNHSCKDIDFYIIKSTLAVSENGAVWLDSDDLSHRSALFLTQNLIIIVEESCLVNNMHEAYEKIVTKNKDYGVFISGPSKTADIEQSLVIGAHGAKILTVYIIKKENNK